MFNINLIDIYSKSIDINNEINLLRIVDKKEKESLVFYCVKEENLYKVYMINTMTGQDTHLKNYNEKYSLNKLIDNIKSIEVDINKSESLEIVENYILKVV